MNLYRIGRGLLLGATLFAFGGCGASSLPHGNLPMSDMSGGAGGGGSPFNNKNYPDPNPHSVSDDAQRAAYQQHQQEQIDEQRANSMPDLSHMTCTGNSASSSGPNAGSFSSSTSCHN
jgi:hypothetical protein